jgi:hypothetical protein
MKVLIVYESMYGNTHTVAGHIAEGFAATDDVEVAPVGEATPDRVSGADLLVVGGPTHVHGMSSARTRADAVSEDTLNREAAKGHDLRVDPDAEGPGLRDWFARLGTDRTFPAAAFDTRIDAAAMITGRASKGIGRKLVRHGATMVADPESFLVDSATTLLDGEEARAVEWGRMLASRAAELTAHA